MTDLESKLDSSAAWMLITRVTVKGLGLISSLILVRILEPADFGVVAIAMSVYSLIELFGLFGFNAAIIQKTNPAKSDYDTTFTINLIFGCVASSFIYFGAPYLSHFFNDIRLEKVFHFLALLFILQGFQNIKVVDFQKNMDFKKELKLQVIPKFLSFFVTLFLAWYLKSYWALIYGMVINSLFNISYSYYALPYKPTLQLVGGRELFKFSKWMMFNNFFYYLNNKSIDLVVGRMVSTTAVGFYSISQEMASIPVTEIAAPINKSSYPAYSKAKDNSELLNLLYYRTISLITLLALPASAGLFAVADVFVPVVLGQKWLQTVEIIKYLSVTSFFVSLTTNNGYVFMALGKPHISTFISFSRTCILFLFFFILITPEEITSPALAMVISATINFFISYLLLSILAKISMTKLLVAIYRPVAAALIMIFCVIIVKDNIFVDQINLFKLLLLMFVGFVVYVFIVYILWGLAGKPNTIEKNILLKFKLVADREQ